MTPEEVLANAEWVRGLARALLRDEHAAEDVVQEAWLAAWKARPRRLRQWLGTVVRNLAAARLRGEVRRTRRERARARADAAPAADESVAKAEWQRRVVGEVLALDEPYRTAVLLRYFEGKSNAAIARATGATPETVRARVHRGLSRLRARLRGRGWLAGLALLACGPRTAAAALPWLAAAATLLAAFTLTVHAVSSPPASTRRTARPDGPARAPDEALAVHTSAPPAPATTAAARRESGIDVVVRADDGRPLAHALVTYGDAAGEISAEMTDEHGRLRLDMKAPGWIEAEHDHAAESVLRHDIEPTRDRTIVLELDTGCVVSGYLVDRDGQRLHGFVRATHDRGGWSRGVLASPDEGFRLERLPRGTHHFHVSTERDTFVARTVPVEVNESRDDLEIVLRRTAVVELTVTSPSAAETPGPHVEYLEGRRVVANVACAFGTHTHRVDPAHITALRVRALRHRPHTVAVVGSFATALTLQPTEPAFVRVRCLDPEGREAAYFDLFDRWRRYRPQDNRYEVPPGRLTLGVRAGGLDPDLVARPLVVDAVPGETMCTFRLGRGGWIDLPGRLIRSVRIEDADGVAFPAVHFIGPIQRDIPDHRRWMSLPPGRWRVTVDAVRGARTDEVVVTPGSVVSIPD